MKTLMLSASLLLVLFSFAQNDVHFVSYRNGFNMHGYIEGKRLDSIAAEYVTVGWGNERQILFDHGQYRDGKKELTVKDNQGLTLQFEEQNLPFLLNFFFFNGWEVQQIVPDVISPNSNIYGRDLYLLKKRHQ